MAVALAGAGPRSISDFTLYTPFSSVSLSKMEYIELSIDTTCMGDSRLQISVKVTTSEKMMVTLSNTCRRRRR